MRIEFTQSSRKHKLGRARIRHVMSHTTATPVTTSSGAPGLQWIGGDERGLELEVIAVVLAPDHLLVIHAMPTTLRGTP